jgi:quinol-cytochrome oxidoreductase complex cytochrome b subunit
MNMDQRNTNAKQIQKIYHNFFLHIHAPRVDQGSLKLTYTFGLGLILSFLFLIMIITGFILLMNYTPSVERAYDSVKDIIFIVPGGRYIRNIHRWAAHGMVLVVFLHMVRTFLTASYQGKRKTNWIIGVFMMLVVLFMNFSGYLLPWDQLAYWAVTIGANIAASARELTDILGITNFIDIGGFFKKLLIGSESVGQAALTRFFMLHIIFFPLTLLILTGWHFWRIRKDGGLAVGEVNESASLQVCKSASKQVNKTDERFYSWPILMWIELATLLFITAVLLLMALLFDAPIREQANPAFAENPAKSPWYFLGIQEIVSYSAFAGGFLIPILFIVFLISIPYFDKETQYTGIWFSGIQGKKILAFSVLFSFVITVFLIFIAVRFGWLREWFDDVSGFVIMLINPATLSALLYIFWSVVILRKTKSARMAAIALFACAITGLIIYTVMGIWFRGPNWEFYWSSSQWPVL